MMFQPMAQNQRQDRINIVAGDQLVTRQRCMSDSCAQRRQIGAQASDSSLSDRGRNLLENVLRRFDLIQQ